MIRKWTGEHLDWVAEHRFSFDSYDALKCAFNDRFGTDATTHAIVGMLRRTGGSAKIKRNKNWVTDEQIEWLREHYGKNGVSSRKLASDFNAKFGTNYRNLVTIANKNGITMDSQSRKRIVSSANSKRLSVPVGSEYVDSSNGYVYVKIKNVRKKGKSSFRDNWMLKQRYVYESAHGPIPKGSVIMFLDGNKSNFSLDNLACVTGREFIHLNTLGWLGNKEITLAGIEVIRTEQIMVDHGVIKRAKPKKGGINRLREYHKIKKTKAVAKYAEEQG